MKVSAFTFIKNGQILGYPFLQSIQSVLPIVDEFIINVGNSDDDTLSLVESISSSKIRIIKSMWNELKVEALVFDFFHFYGNSNSYIDSPGWYRSEARIIRNSIRSYAPDGLFWLV